jgi:uncharacterized protein YdeI (YjbR/CyaY-like superfamily)
VASCTVLDVGSRLTRDAGPGALSDAVFFATNVQFRAWLAEHHDTAVELIVGFWKAGSGRPSMTWPESVGAALCFGWIDGVRRRRDDESYTIRFTRRRPGSIWSAVNVAKVEALVAAGLMAPAGLVAFAARRADRTAVYSHEQGGNAVLTLNADEQARLRAAPGAWEHFDAQPGWYRRAVVHWLHSAKREETRARRLEQLVVESAAGQHIAQFRRR